MAGDGVKDKMLPEGYVCEAHSLLHSNTPYYTLGWPLYKLQHSRDPNLIKCL